MVPYELDAECFFELLYDGYSEGFVSYLEAVRKRLSERQISRRVPCPYKTLVLFVTCGSGVLETGLILVWII